MRGGGGCGVAANENSCTHHVKWSPNELWRSNSIFNLGLNSIRYVVKSVILTLSFYWRLLGLLSGIISQFPVIATHCNGIVETPTPSKLNYNNKDTDFCSLKKS
jgi:hypothetical protein